MEVSELLDQAKSYPYPFSERDKQVVRRLAEDHPYHLQSAAEYLWEMKKEGEVDYEALRRYLCEQPHPPAMCSPPKRNLTAKLVAWLLGLVLAGGVLWWVAPRLKLCLTDFGEFWRCLGSFGDGVEALILIVIFIIVVIGGLLKRKRLVEIWLELWERVT